jgi:H+-transporting ATPase
MAGAAMVAIALSSGGGRPPDWEAFVGIVLLLVINWAVGFYKDLSVRDVVDVRARMKSIASKARVCRHGAWREIDSEELVPGDIVAFKSGEMVPADCRLTKAADVYINQAALTGESLPQRKKRGDHCFS